ncbi:leukotriene A-4 hydrolase-like [Temnothorax nylanderi]|uniref:leukotriene A-4 hydrolase-like n=1 Tax=Temnothorax nylanderi TaxID=102681 RepID=UPI003A87890F
MDIAGSTEDPYSSAKPDLARVTHIDLELDVDFTRKVLQGKAMLTIKRKHSAQKVILDNYELDIKSVTNPKTESPLNYNNKHQVPDNEHHGALGSSFIIDLPPIVDTAYEPVCQIQIEYETSPKSPALYWLTPEQTADGEHPFLLSNNKLIYARAWFPCQDTPSVKFTYSAMIKVQKNYEVIMSALLQNISKGPERDVYEFKQINPVPSYAVVISVGALKKKHLRAKINIFAEKKFIGNIVSMFENTIENILKTAESLCGAYSWDRHDICVLPPSAAHFEIECPCVTFISPTLLRGDCSSISSLAISSLARNILQSWTGSLVTCSNYKHLWLNKSFNIFISRKIKSELLLFYFEDIKSFLKREGLNNLKNMLEDPKNDGLIKCLLPNLTARDLPPQKVTEYVPYEAGCMLLGDLENMLGGPSVFEPFFKSYFNEFAFKSINTQEWMDYLYQYFSEKKKMLDGVAWDTWFHNIPSVPDVPAKTAWETNFFELAEKLVIWDNNPDNLPAIGIYKRPVHNVEFIIFLNDLNFFHTDLTEEKLESISNRYNFDRRNCEIRCLWLQLCIKVRWGRKVAPALDFAIQYCSLNYARPIFQHLYEWTDMRRRVIRKYKNHKIKMLDETQKELEKILELNS